MNTAALPGTGGLDDVSAHRHTPDPVRARIRAAVLLLAVGSAAVGGVVWPAALAPPPGPPTSGGGVTTDASTFAGVVDRLRAGESYHSAMGSELRHNGYPTRSPFNWRTPLLLSAVATGPDLLSRVALSGLNVAFVVATLVLIRGGVEWGLAAAMAFGVLVVSSVAEAVYFGEAWAGAVIGLSAWAYSAQRRWLGLGLAILAVFLRELAAPYCVMCALITGWNQRWREFAAWVVGAAAYAIYYGWHVSQVVAHRMPADEAHAGTWLTMLGLPFLQGTLLKVGWLVLMPPWLSPFALAALTAGIVADRTPLVIRTASAIYAAFFLIAGYPFNTYWGFIAAPLWAVTCAYGVAAVVDAARLLRLPTTRQR